MQVAALSMHSLPPLSLTVTKGETFGLPSTHQAPVTFSKPWSRRTFPWLWLWRRQMAHQHILLWHFIKLLRAPRGPVLLHSQQGALRQHGGVVVIRGDVSTGGLVGVCRWMPPSHGKGNFRRQHVRVSGTTRQLQACESVNNEWPDHNTTTIQMTGEPRTWGLKERLLNQ